MYSILLSKMSQRIHQGLNRIKSYVAGRQDDEAELPFPPVARFWEIQRAFAAADVAFLKILLGPDLFPGATHNLKSTVLAIYDVSHETVINTSTEFSVHYSFEDRGDAVNQVWHYQLFESDWKLNGIEGV